VKRREFIAGLAGSAAAWPVAAGAQQPSIPVVGFLGAQTPELFVSRLRGFREGLAESGYSEGRNVAIEYRWAEGQSDRLPALVGDLVRRQVAVIATSSTSSSVAAKAGTKTIPIVFLVSSDPVQLGLVQSLNRPGGNATGSTNLGVEVGLKRLALVHELLPAAKLVGLLVHPANPGAQGQISEYQSAARALGLELRVLRASSEDEIDSAFGNAAQFGVEAIVISPDSFFNTRSQRIATIALQMRMPTIYNEQSFATAGGLIAYGASFTDQWRLSGTYAGRILKGEKPADLPVQQSTKVELILNLKTARTLGLAIPPTLLATADQVIE